MSAAVILLTIGLGILAEVIGFILLRRLLKLDSKTAAVSVAMLALLIYVPWGVITWPGGDVFAIHLALYLIVAYMLGIIGHRQDAGGPAGRRWHWAPALLVAFFSFVVAVDVVFLVAAEQGITGLFARLLPEPRSGGVADSRFPGTVSHDYQKKEALYNEYLQQVQQQTARGWQTRMGWQQRPLAGQPAVFLLEVKDGEGAPVTGAVVSGQFLRTSNSEHDFAIEMIESEPGLYRLDTLMPLPGLWRLVLKVQQGDDVHEIRATTSIEGSAQ